MTVREYIGARYVPIFMGEWVQANTYEPLSVVTYQGASYTSRQFVPANVEITNTDYWYVSANYNAQIEAYRQEVVQVSTQIGDIEDDIADEVSAREAADTALGTRIDGETTAREAADTALGTRITDEETARIAADAALGTRIDGIESELAYPFSEANIYTGTNLVWFGDSFSIPSGANSVDGYLPKRVNRVLGTNLFNFAVAGRGFGRATSLIQNDVATASAQMSEEQRMNTSIVVCVCGCNDLLNSVEQSAIVNGFTTFATNVHNTFPNAHVYVFPFNWGCNHLSHNARVTIDNCLNNFMSLEQPWFSVVPYAWTWVLGLPSRCQNSVHPNSTGYSYIAGYVLNAISGHNYASPLAQTYDFSNSDMPRCDVFFTYQDDIVHMFGTYSKNTDGGGWVVATSNAHPLLVPWTLGTRMAPSVSASSAINHDVVRIDTDRTMRMGFPSNYVANTNLFFETSFRPDVGAAY